MKTLLILLMIIPTFAMAEVPNGDGVMLMNGYPFSIESDQMCKDLGYESDVCHERASLPAFMWGAACRDLKAQKGIKDIDLKSLSNGLKGKLKSDVSKDEVDLFVRRYKKIQKEADKVCSTINTALQRKAAKEQLDYLIGLGIVTYARK